mgnify:CR=1 FL=1
MKKRTIAVLLTMAMAATMMAGCGSKSDSKTADGEKSYTIGISQFAEHGSLDNCREGFLEGLKEEGIVEIIDLRIKPENLAELIDNQMYFPGYHMNKKHWFTICLDGSVPLEEIFRHIDSSYIPAV